MISGAISTRRAVRESELYRPLSKENGRQSRIFPRILDRAVRPMIFAGYDVATGCAETVPKMSTPARSRTRNSSLGPRNDLRFTTRAASIADCGLPIELTRIQIASKSNAITILNPQSAIVPVLPAGLEPAVFPPCKGGAFAAQTTGVSNSECGLRISQNGHASN